MKEKLEQAITKCLEENGYFVRQVTIGNLPKVFATGEDSLMLTDVNIKIKATKDTSFKQSLGY